MSKFVYAVSFIKKISKSTPIVHEIPTYPLDTGNSFLYSVRDFIEFKTYKLVNPYIKMALVNLIDSISVPDNWTIFRNGMDIDNYEVPVRCELADTIRFIMVATISEYHHYERMLYAMKEYINTISANDESAPTIENSHVGDIYDSCKVQLTVISPDSAAYDTLRQLASELNISDFIDFRSSMPLPEIQKIANTCHIGVGQLSDSSKGSNLVNTLKSKDYCAMGIPFFSTCYDTSFEKGFQYAYITDDMDSKIDLSAIISWYKDIYKDTDYREKMYNYAKNNLQYDFLAMQIINT